jgi:hypothetical protein
VLLVLFDYLVDQLWRFSPAALALADLVRVAAPFGDEVLDVEHDDESVSGWKEKGCWSVLFVLTVGVIKGYCIHLPADD